MILHDAVGKLLTSLAILKISSLASCNCLVKDSQCVAVLCATCPTFTPWLGKTRCEKIKSDNGKFATMSKLSLSRVTASSCFWCADQDQGR